VLLLRPPPPPRPLFLLLPPRDVVRQPSDDDVRPILLPRGTAPPVRRRGATRGRRRRRSRRRRLRRERLRRDRFLLLLQADAPRPPPGRNPRDLRRNFPARMGSRLSPPSRRFLREADGSPRPHPRSVRVAPRRRPEGRGGAGALEETDHSTPRPHGGWWYYTRTFEGSSYKTYCRAPKTTESLPVISWDGTKEAPILPGEEAYLDVNELAKDRSYCSVGTVETSPSGKLVAYAVDFSGDEKYELRVRDLEAGEDVALTKVGSDAPLEVDDAVWGGDDDVLYYVTVDEQHRPHRLYRRRGWRGESPEDVLLKEEPDDLYWCEVSKSLDEKYVFFDLASKETSEVWYLSVEDEKGGDPPELKCVAPRRDKVLYEVEHGNGTWIVWTNEGGLPNMKLVSAPAAPDSADDWKLVEDAGGRPIFDGSLAKSLDSVTVLNAHLVAEGREGGIPRIWIYDLASKHVRRLEFEESAYDLGLLAHYEPDAKSVAVSYDSMVTPTSSIEIALDDDSRRTVLKARAVPGYDKDAYGCDRLEVIGRDGKTRIPISVVYRKETMEKVREGERVPVHLYGYGSYGSCVEADFDATRLPLIDRGMIYVVAHVWGGGEMGRQWYEEPDGGKYLCKKNTFDDFVDVARFLADEWTTPDMLSCEGRSAGGLLIGAAMNQDPELFRAAILGVPFVDVAVTMTDATIPLTSGEWDHVPRLSFMRRSEEWGCSSLGLGSECNYVITSTQSSSNYSNATM
ncbi:hypothetical protein ACHAWF_012955, partial [Thalassiosira exigua]